MAVLSEAHKEAIVIQLAHFRRPAEVVEFMREHHELDLTVQQVRTYDPTNPRFEADRDKWPPIFEAAREAYITNVKAIPIANQAFRLNELADLYDKAKKQKNYKLAAELAEQAAREVGGVLTNSRELNINDGRKAREMSPEDRAAALGAIISDAMAAAKDAQPGVTTH